MSISITDQEKTIFRQEIAVLNNLRLGDVDDEELALHLDLTIRGEMDPYIVDKYIGYISDNREYEEVMNYLVQLSEGLLDRETSFASYGLFMIDYLRALKDFNAISHQALLVGAHTPNTIKEFVWAIKHTAPQATPTITDLQGVTTVKMAHSLGCYFPFGNATALPFQRQSLDSVHTNVLLPHIQQARSLKDGREGFFKEAFRVLRPEGLLVMAEWLPNLNEQAFISQIELELNDAGFSHVESSVHANRISRRHNLNRLMKRGNLPIDMCVPDDVVSFFIAGK